MANDDVPDISEEDRAAIREALLTWKKEGVAHPLIPIDHDVNGDGVFDSFGLDENNELIVVTDAHLDDTVYEATGEGIEGEGGEAK